MTDAKQPREQDVLKREPKPELDKETLEDLDLDEQTEQVKGGIAGTRTE